MMKNKHQSSKLEIIAAAVIIGTILALSVVVVVVVITQQEASALASTTFTFDQYQTNKFSGLAGCTNSGTITFGLGGGHNPGHP
jgi:type II secretory pathway pseudopilin PulG